MRSLVPCASCNRHLESHEATCPFCGAARTPEIDPGVCTGPCGGHASPRLSRAALVAVGATLLCASCFRGGAAAYGTYVGPIPDGGMQGTDAGSRDDGGDGGAPTDDGGQTDGGVDGGKG